MSTSHSHAYPNGHTIFLSLGANQGDRKNNIEQALQRLEQVITIQAISSLYETEPVGDGGLPLLFAQEGGKHYNEEGGKPYNAERGKIHNAEGGKIHNTEGGKIHNTEGGKLYNTEGGKLYNTEGGKIHNAEGGKPLPYFLNLACQGRTNLEPDKVLIALKEIEASMGRRPSFRNAPRPIDIDILLYNNLQLTLPQLVIPHPRMRERAFVLTPLAEIAPLTIEPISGQTIQQLAANISTQGIRKLPS